MQPSGGERHRSRRTDMIKPLIQFTVAVIISSLLTDVASAKWSIYEAYSNTDGSVRLHCPGTLPTRHDWH